MNLTTWPQLLIGVCILERLPLADYWLKAFLKLGKRKKLCGEQGGSSPYFLHASVQDYPGALVEAPHGLLSLHHLHCNSEALLDVSRKAVLNSSPQL